MTSVDGGTLSCQTESPFVGANSHAFFGTKIMKNSEEVDSGLDEATSTDSPKSKDSWPTSTATDVDVSPLKNNRDDIAPQSQETTTVERENHTVKAIGGVYDDDEEKVEVRREPSRDEQQSGMEMIATSELPKEVSGESPQCSTDSAIGVESMDLHGMSPVMGQDVVEKVEKREDGELSDDDDGFGDFEQAGHNFEAPDDERRTAETDDDEFGDFEVVVSPPEPSRSARPFAEELSGSQCTAGDRFLSLNGRDYTTAAASTLGGIAIGKPLMTYSRQKAVGVNSLRFNSCSESRLGVQLLYPRPIPAGFLRSSGMPVLVSSKIVAAEQTFLTKLGLYNIYKSLQFRSTTLEQDTPGDSSRSSLHGETHSKNSVSETQSMNDGLSFDLDFLVEFSSHQLAAGSVSSNKTGMEGSLHEDMRQHSNLHDLFDGIVRSSQSSFVSRSSELSDQAPERSQKSFADFDPLPQPPPHPQESCLDEPEWSAFTGSRHQTALDTQRTDENLRFKETEADEWNDFTTVSAAAPSEEVVNSSNNQNLIQENSGEDIFSGEWLDQLRSSHEHPEAAPIQCILSSAGPSCADDPAETEWGTFTEAPQCQSAERGGDPFQHLMPAQPHLSQAPPIGSLLHASDPPLPTAAAKRFDLDALDSLIMMNSSDSKRSQPLDSLIAMDTGVLMGSSGTDGGVYDNGHPQMEEEWGLFQG